MLSASKLYRRTGLNRLKSVLLILVVIIILPGMVAGHGKKMPRKLQRALYKAQQEQNKGETDKAIDILQDYLKKNPEKEPVILLSYLGSLHFQAENLEDAYQAFSRGFKGDPTNAGLCRNLAVVSYQLEKIDLAAGYFEKAYDLSPEKDINLLYQAATSHYSTGHFDKTIRVVKRYRTIVEVSEPRWTKLIIYCHLERKEWLRAKKEIRSYLELYPQDEKFWDILAKLYLEEGDYRQGAAALEVFYSLSPPEDAGWLELADIYLYLDAPLKAVTCYQHVRDRFSDKNLEKIVAAYRSTCQYESAAKLITEALAHHETAEGYKSRGMIYYDGGLYRKSIESLSKSLELNPRQNETNLLLGYAALELNDLERAKTAFSNISEDADWVSQARAGMHIVDSLLEAKREAEESAINM